MKYGTVLIALVIFTVMAHPASAVLIAYEGFDYAPGTQLQNQAGSGTGIGTIPAHSLTDFRFNSNPADLGYTDGSLSLVTSGRAASIDAVTSGTQDLNLPLLAPVSSGDLYFSYLVKVEAVTTFGIRWGLLSGASENGGTAQAEVRSTSVGPDNFGNFQSGGFDDRTGPTAVASNVYFVVGRITGLAGAAGAGTMTTWWNPADLSDVPGSASTIVASTGGTFANSITHVWMGLQGEEDAVFDEIRLGTTLDDVVVVIPEPGVVSLLALGGLLFAIRRRRG